MRILILTILLEVVTLVTAAKTFKDVLIDGITTDTDTQIYTNATNAYNGSPASLTALQQAYNVVLGDWMKITSDTNDIVAPVYNDAVAVSFYFNYTVSNSTFVQLNALVAKKNTFNQYGILGTVCQLGRNLQGNISAAFTAFYTKYPAPIKLWANNTRLLYNGTYNLRLTDLGCTPRLS